MALGKQVGEFSLKATTFTVTPGPAGSVLVQANFEGPVTGFGTVLVTMTAASAGQKNGTWSLCSVSYPETGDSVTANGQGTFESVGPNRWRTQGVAHLADGRTLVSEGEIALATRTWSGKIFERS